MATKLVDIHTHNPSDDTITVSSYGVHPWYADEGLLPLDCALFEGVDGVGEIGLDYACGADKQTQQRLFEAQLQIAEQLDKIVVIHCVRAYNEVLATLSMYTLQRVIFHGFVGSEQLASQILGRGYYLSFGERTFSSPKTIEALRKTPLSKLFVESDQSEVGIQYIYAKVAEILEISEGELAKKIYENYKEIIG
ncbi:MAG: TatD family hydrolase [Rikenellaceae bacterium]